MPSSVANIATLPSSGSGIGAGKVRSAGVIRVDRGNPVGEAVVLHDEVRHPRELGGGSVPGLLGLTTVVPSTACLMATDVA